MLEAQIIACKGFATEAFPSAQDYFGTYLINEGGRRDMHGIVYDAGTDRAYAFDGKVNPDTGAPEFHRLTPSGPKQIQEWMDKHMNSKPGSAV